MCRGGVCSARVCRSEQDWEVGPNQSFALMTRWAVSAVLAASLVLSE